HGITRYCRLGGVWSGGTDQGWGGRMSENAETGVGELLNATGLLERVSDQALQLVPAAQGVLVGLCNDQYVTYVSGAGFLAPHVGTRVDKDASLSGLAMRTRQIVHCGDTEQDPHAD